MNLKKKKEKAQNQIITSQQGELIEFNTVCAVEK